MFGGHQFAGNRVTDNEIDFIDVMRLDQTRHVACASSCVDENFP